MPRVLIMVVYSHAAGGFQSLPILDSWQMNDTILWSYLVSIKALLSNGLARRHSKPSSSDCVRHELKTFPFWERK